MTKVEDLERQGLIRKLPPDLEAVENAIGPAHRDVSVAKNALTRNAMLQAARELMFSRGYRPAGNNQHAAVVQFAGQFLNTANVDALDRMRGRRQIVVYGMAGTVSQLEAENAGFRAESFLSAVEDLLR